MNESHAHIADLKSEGAHIAPVKLGDDDGDGDSGLAKAMKDAGADTARIIPSSVREKLKATRQIVEAAKKAEV